MHRIVSMSNERRLIFKLLQNQLDAFQNLFRLKLNADHARTRTHSDTTHI